MYFFNGQIADVQIYNIDLSASQIQTLYNKGIGGISVLPANTVGAWALNGNAIDTSGNGNDGTAYSVAYPYLLSSPPTAQCQASASAG